MPERAVNVEFVDDESHVEPKGMDHLGEGKWKFRFQLTTDSGEEFEIATQSTAQADDLSEEIVQAYMEVAQRLGDLAVAAEQIAERLSSGRTQR